MKRKSPRPQKEQRRKRYRLKRKAYILNSSMVAESPAADGNVHVIENLKQIHEREVKEFKERMLRVHADLENYRKRAERERREIVKFANESVFLGLLPVVDNFRHAFQSMEKSDDPAAVIDGVKLIYDQLIRILKDSGLEEIDASDKEFDPRYHEAMAVGYIENLPENVVLEVFREGYQLNDRVLRPALVKVNKKPVEDKSVEESVRPGPEIKPEPLEKQTE